MRKPQTKALAALLAAPITYRYHVAYFWTDRKGGTGWGTIHMERNLPISDFEQIESVCDYIKDRNCFTKVGLVNWILL